MAASSSAAAAAASPSRLWTEQRWRGRRWRLAPAPWASGAAWRWRRWPRRGGRAGGGGSGSPSSSHCGGGCGCGDCSGGCGCGGGGGDGATAPVPLPSSSLESAATPSAMPLRPWRQAPDDYCVTSHTRGSSGVSASWLLAGWMAGWELASALPAVPCAPYLWIC
jgi:hypothetical protein